MADALLLNGTVGAGKTTTARALGTRLARTGVPHAVIDLDALRLLDPPPRDDPFQWSLTVENTRDVSRNLRAAGAERLVIAGVVETAEQLDELRTALRPWTLHACVLVVDAAAAEERLRIRHRDDEPGLLAWHVDRSPRLAEILASIELGDVLVVGSEGPDEIAERAARTAGW